MDAARAAATGFKAATLALATLPLLGMRPSVLVVGLWVLSAVAYRLIAGARNASPDMRTFLLLSLPFLAMLLDLLRAPDPVQGWHIVERSGMLALAPLVVFVLRPPIDEGLRVRAIDVFTLAAIGLALYANLSIVASGLPGEGPFQHRYRAAFSAATGIHPPYAAYFTLSAALFQLERAVRSAEGRAWRLGAVAVLVLAAMAIASRTPLLAFVAAALGIFALRMPGRTALRAGIGLLLLLAGLVLVVPSARQRMKEVFTTPAGIPDAQAVNSVSERFAIAHCSTELLRRHWVVGMGQASVQPALDACYSGLADPRYADGSHDTHCQPLHWWLSFGLPGLLLFLLLFGAPLAAAWHQRDVRLGLFLVFFGLCCLTENVLARQWGVVPFAFFLSLLSPPLGAGSARDRNHR
ncbi:MAG: O-antigen ligase family protein [Flavobacteriales bacterium]|nr:O-antigen ligase family protein [Flavobacteriales bacterium]